MVEFASGTFPRLDPGLRIYAVGDIHGRLDKLMELQDLIRRDLTRDPPDQSIVIYLGDYIDRGPDSKGVISQLADGGGPGDEQICLPGNHEALMLEFLSDLRTAHVWLRNGGEATLRSYGVTPPDPEDPVDLRRAQIDLALAMPASHREFLRKLVLFRKFGDYLFVHAGIRPGVPLEKQRRDDLIWIRGTFLDSAQDHGMVVVHGHTITGMPEFWGNRIGIDTGAYDTGRLTALILEESRQLILQTESDA